MFPRQQRTVFIEDWHWPDPMDYPLVRHGFCVNRIRIKDRRIPCPNGCGEVKKVAIRWQGHISTNVYSCERCGKLSFIRREEIQNAA
jgi:hypothetical protein